jgi:hypothetical protein
VRRVTEVVNAKNKRLADFTREELSRYASYCVNDVDLTRDVFKIMVEKFPKQELKLIDLTLRMFIDPVLDLDTGLLETHLDKIKDWKDELLDKSGTTKEDLMSNPKFAELLKGLDVDPPMKISPEYPRRNTHAAVHRHIQAGSITRPYSLLRSAHRTLGW